jgi:ring-1,2-phenylacetyl-CoA epoxidase subunit PaaE
LLRDHPSKKIVLVYSNRSVEYAIFYEELKKLQQEYPGKFKIEFLFSNATRNQQAVGYLCIGKIA